MIAYSPVFKCIEMWVTENGHAINLAIFPPETNIDGFQFRSLIHKTSHCTFTQ
jgi:hypothetical protein